MTWTRPAASKVITSVSSARLAFILSFCCPLAHSCSTTHSPLSSARPLRLYTRVVVYYNAETGFTLREACGQRDGRLLTKSRKRNRTIERRGLTGRWSAVFRLHHLVSDPCARCRNRRLTKKQDSKQRLFWCHQSFLPREKLPFGSLTNR